LKRSSVASLGIALPILISASMQCWAQSAPIILVPGTVVTGNCYGRGSQPGCVLPNLYGSTGLTLFNSPAFSHFAHFVGSAQTTLNQTLSTAIATQLAILPIISPASGFTYKYDSSVGAFVRTSSSFGPIYTERADTIGRGKISFGVSYQRFRFGNLDGINLHNVPAVFTHIPGTGPGGADETYEADVIKTSNNIDLNMDQTLLYGTVGITDRIDVSVAIPLVSVRMGVSSDDQIIRVSGPTFVLQPTGRVVSNPHEFNADGALTNVYTSNGDASGLGDVTFRIKGKILETENVRVALAMDVRAPTGDALRLLGSGATGIKPFVAISAGKRLSPHLNVGYQWNGKSILAGNVTGTTVSENAADQTIVQNGNPIKRGLPDQVFYSLGVDYGLTSRLTLVADYLGQTLINTPRVFQTNFVTQNIPGGTGALTLANITGGTDTIGINSGAVGFKYNLFDQLLLTGDILFRLDNRGLRQDVTPLIALSYAFGK
jgi:hypothetical protein